MRYKTILSLCLFLFCGACMAQNTDAGGTDLVRSVSAKYQAYTSMKFHYTLKATKESKTLSSSQGDFALRGDKYHAV
ncbi:MAG: hypothetical protein J6S48_05375, partial [Bacteroidales bacterium]|nr:hypothetical protein [Bacteroidales bacterium]